METIIKIPKELETDLRRFVHELGFSGDSEFVEEAVKDKVLELKRKEFFKVSDKIAQALNGKGINHREMLEDFEKSRE
ncbi:hypothetical protein HYT24_00190 [Candidatus Pacearchaeota archaeon]|nr:hypothetical protein [Candidatus Pacearchaeota archaeon]